MCSMVLFTLTFTAAPLTPSMSFVLFLFLNSLGSYRALLQAQQEDNSQEPPWANNTNNNNKTAAL